ncbi:MAG: transglutaminase family protein [Hyphomicrobiales bacterium]|nr:transglutaminase family protein [Hyphomicrobiales bacterium]
MHIRYGYRIDLLCTDPTPVIMMLDVHPERRADLTMPDEPRVTAYLTGVEQIDVTRYLDKFGNVCRRVVAPPGGITIEADGIIPIHDGGFPDPIDTLEGAHSPEQLPDDTLMYLLGSRYCETDQLSQVAWNLFGAIPGGWNKVQAVCDYVHRHIRFNNQQARATRTALQAYEERVGVCRDYVHLALTFCRCLNIPARYCTVYLGDIGVPASDAPGDFSGWFEAYLGHRWWTFDARHNMPRIGRILIGRGRDATDVRVLNSFGPHGLGRFEIVTEEVTGDRYPMTSQHRRDHWALNASLHGDQDVA